MAAMVWPSPSVVLEGEMVVDGGPSFPAGPEPDPRDEELRRFIADDAVGAMKEGVPFIGTLSGLSNRFEEDRRCSGFKRTLPGRQSDKNSVAACNCSMVWGSKFVWV